MFTSTISGRKCGQASANWYDSLPVCLFGLVIVASLSLALGQEQPPINCPQHFKYEHRNGQWVGVITTPNADNSNIDVSASFSLRDSQSSDVLGALQPYPDKETATRDLTEGRELKFFVRFHTGNVLPKITKIDLNGRSLCQADGYPPPSTTLIRIQKIKVVKTVINNVNDISNLTSSNFSQFGNIGNFGNGGSLGDINIKFPPLTSLLNGQSPEINSDDLFKNMGDPVGGNSNNVGSNAVISTRLDECGNEGFVPFMHGGTTLERGRFPWLVAIYHDDNPDPNVVNLQFKCGATLTGARKVITAAHCVFGIGRDKIRVYMGRHDLYVHPEEGAVIGEIENLVIHPDYTGEIVPDADVAVLTLSAPVQFTRYIRPICIWRAEDPLGPDGGLNGNVAGWGIDENGEMTQLPKTVAVKTVSQETCLRDMVAAKDYLTRRTICAGNGQAHGPCMGDSGGGLMIKRNDRWLLRGIISFGSRLGDQCDLRRYVIYCDLAKHTDWIKQNS